MKSAELRCSDITSPTRFNNYQVLAIPELWGWNGTQSEINVLVNSKYVKSNSNIFSDLPTSEIIPEFLTCSSRNDASQRVKITISVMCFEFYG